MTLQPGMYSLLEANQITIKQAFMLLAAVLFDAFLTIFQTVPSKQDFKTHQASH